MDRETPWAKGISEKSKRAARKLLTQGNKLVEKGLSARAVAKYKEALKFWDHPGLHYNLAQAYVNLDQPLQVHKSLQRALRYGSKPIGEEKYQQGQAYMKLLENRLARIDIVCSVPGATVTLNGKMLFTGANNRSVVLEAGNHQLVASKPGLVSDSKPVALSPGEKKRIELEPKTLERLRATTRRWTAWKPWAVVVAGGVVMLGGGIIHWRSGENYDEFDRQFAALPCAMMDGCEEADGSRNALEPKLDHAGQLQAGALVSYAVGGAALITGIYLVYLNRPALRDGMRDNNPRAEAGRMRATVMPFISVDSAGLRARIRF